MRLVLALCLVFVACKREPQLSREALLEKAKTSFVLPTWHEKVVESDTIAITFGYRYELYKGHRGFGPGTRPDEPFTAMGERKVLTAEQTADLKERLAGTFTTMGLKCIAHTDGAAFLEDGTEIDFCFGCGTVVAEGIQWNRVDGDRMEKFFRTVLGNARPHEPPDLTPDPDPY